ncbi:MAG: hypothetical protein ACPH5G_13390 [Pseudooceanicola atlanticus]
MNARTAYETLSTEQIEVALFLIEHEALSEPIRLSTDPTERLSIEPLQYGTRSRWMDSDPEAEPFPFVLASAEFPSDLEDAPAAATIVLDNVAAEMAQVLRSVTSRATVHMAVVLASSPDLLEAEFRDLKLIGSEGTADEIVLSISRQPIEDEIVPMDRFSKDRFPGLFR